MGIEMYRRLQQFLRDRFLRQLLPVCCMRCSGGVLLAGELVKAPVSGLIVAGAQFMLQSVSVFHLHFNLQFALGSIGFSDGLCGCH